MILSMYEMKKPKNKLATINNFLFWKISLKCEIVLGGCNHFKGFFLSFEKTHWKNMIYGFGSPYLKHLDCQITTRLQFF
jgi:hypothetical protein